MLIRSEPLDASQIVTLRQALFDRFQPLGSGGQPSVAAISITDVSGTWGGQITRQALIALAVFLVLVTIFLAFYFERAMAIAALVALVHDVVVTMGVYSIVGFEVTPGHGDRPADDPGLLALRHRRRVRQGQGEHRGLLGLTRRTYAEAANLALNQTLMRSINTSLIAVLPVLGLMVVGVGLLGVGTLADLALVQIVGILAGAASSVLLADPAPGRPQAARPAHPRRRPRRVAARRARRAAAPAGEAGGAEPGPADDEVLAGELRRERAMAAAAGRPGPHGIGRPRGRAPAAHRQARRGRPGSGAGDRRLGRTGADSERHRRTDPLARVSALVRDVPDFPAAGRRVPRHHPGAGRRRRPSRTVAVALAALVGEADVVVGVEARGFLLGAAAALTAGTGIVPVRKAGKLPRVAASRSYDAGVRHRDARAARRRGGGRGARVRRRRRAGHRRHGRGGLRPGERGRAPRSSGSR